MRNAIYRLTDWLAYVPKWVLAATGVSIVALGTVWALAATGGSPALSPYAARDAARAAACTTATTPVKQFTNTHSPSQLTGATATLFQTKIRAMEKACSPAAAQVLDKTVLAPWYKTAPLPKTAATTPVPTTPGTTRPLPSYCKESAASHLPVCHPPRP